MQAACFGGFAKTIQGVLIYPSRGRRTGKLRMGFNSLSPNVTLFTELTQLKGKWDMYVSKWTFEGYHCPFLTSVRVHTTLQPALSSVS